MLLQLLCYSHENFDLVEDLFDSKYATFGDFRNKWYKFLARQWRRKNNEWIIKKRLFSRFFLDARVPLSVRGMPSETAESQLPAGASISGGAEAVCVAVVARFAHAHETHPVRPVVRLHHQLALDLVVGGHQGLCVGLAGRE